jgi:putative hydrolase of the HAD superfamily
MTDIQAPDIQAVLFDYGLVLTYGPDPTAWAEMKRILDAPEDTFHAAYWRYRHEYDRGTLNGAGYWNSVAADVSRILTAAELTDLIDADTALWTVPNPDTITWAAALQRAGVKTGILSNLGDAMETGVRKRCPWLADFTHQTYSHRLNLIKPDPAIYQHAAAGLNLAPENILFLDDREENIAAARVSGMTAIQYTNHPDFIAAMQNAGLGALFTPRPATSFPNP